MIVDNFFIIVGIGVLLTYFGYRCIAFFVDLLAKNEETQEELQRQQKEYQEKIFNALVEGNYEWVDHRNYYRFFIDGEIEVIGIVSVVDAFGINFREDVRREREKRQNPKAEVIYLNQIKAR
tara:strand:- start:11093 stop:11458 length:366 start_codon:yes stop_codon:yes gene_type:complete